MPPDSTGVSTTTELEYLNGGTGVRTTDGSVVDMAGSESLTQLSTLNNGGGVHTKPGKDLKITLTDSSVVFVALSSAATVADVENLIDLASYGRVLVSLNSAGTGLVLTDTQTHGGNLTVASGNGSTAAADLGILGTGVGNTLTGQPISDNSTDIRITLTNGSNVYVDLSLLQTISDVLSAIDSASTDLDASLVNGAIHITDSSGGTGLLTVTESNGSFAAADLGILRTATSGQKNTLVGKALGIGSVTITGGGASQLTTLTGSPGSTRSRAAAGMRASSAGAEPILWSNPVTTTLR